MSIKSPQVMYFVVSAFRLAAKAMTHVVASRRPGQQLPLESCTGLCKQFSTEISKPSKCVCVGAHACLKSPL